MIIGRRLLEGCPVLAAPGRAGGQGARTVGGHGLQRASDHVARNDGRHVRRRRSRPRRRDRDSLRLQIDHEASAARKRLLSAGDAPFSAGDAVVPREAPHAAAALQAQAQRALRDKSQLFHYFSKTLDNDPSPTLKP